LLEGALLQMLAFVDNNTWKHLASVFSMSITITEGMLLIQCATLVFPNVSWDWDIDIQYVF